MLPKPLLPWTPSTSGVFREHLYRTVSASCTPLSDSWVVTVREGVYCTRRKVLSCSTLAFAYYYCKQCPCKSLHWQFSDRRHCDDCGHSPMQHLCYWNNEILTPIQKYGMDGPGDTAFKKLKILLDRMMLRRTKLERADDLGLPPRTIIVRRDHFSPEEKELYLSLFSETRRTFSTYIAEGTVLNSKHPSHLPMPSLIAGLIDYSNIFSLITRSKSLTLAVTL